MKQFRDDFGVYVCPHVFIGSADVIFAVRDFDGDWQFLCGAEHDAESEGPHHIGVGHLTAVDTRVHELAVLMPGQFAERQSTDSEWKIGDLDPE